MALQYPGISFLKGYDGSISDVFDQWNAGEAAGKTQRFEDQAPDQFAKALPPLAEYGLTTSPEDLKAMFANPNTRDVALAQVKDAWQRRSDAMDPLKQLQLKKAQYDVAHQGDAPRNTTLDNANTRMKLGWEQGLRGEALRTYVLSGDLLKPEAGPTAPAGYQMGADGSMAFIPGGPADPANPLNQKKTGNGAPSPTIAKEIFEADEGAQAGESVVSALDTALELNKTAWDGPLADAGTQAGALFGDKNSVDTQQMKNLVTAQALDQLKATFGGMPTEGERKILLDIQGSVTQPREVRERIFKRAKAAAERRIQFNKEKAAGLRNGDYFDEGYSPVTAPGTTAADTDVDAILKDYGL